MGTHRIGWRRTAVCAWAAALTGQAPLAGAVEACAAIEGAAARSACIERQAAASSSEGQAARASRPQALAATQTVQSSIVLLDRLPGGELVFRLANGQAWAQQAARFIAVEAGERVIIAPARIGGGHILATERSATARVRRLVVEPAAQP